MTLSKVINMNLTIIMRLYAEGVREGIQSIEPYQPGLTDVGALTQASRFKPLA